MTQEELKLVPLDAILSNRYQPRLDFVDDELDELAASIREVGLLHPPLISPIPGSSQYEIISGERRVLACRRLGFTHINAICRAKPPLQIAALAALIENVQRVDLNPVEIARSMKMLIDNFRFSQEEVALKTGKKRSTVANYLRILQLPREHQEAISRGVITLAHAKVLLSCSPSTREALFQRMVREELTVQEAVKFVKAASKRRGSGKKAGQIHLQMLEERLQRRFGTRVEVAEAKKGGAIKLYFYSLDDLDRLLEAFQVEVGT